MDSLPTELAELLGACGEQLELPKTTTTSAMIIRPRSWGKNAYDKLNRLFTTATRCAAHADAGASGAEDREGGGEEV